MSRRIELEYTYPHPIDRVWHALTDREALASWFMETDLVPEVGAEFTFRTEPAPGFDGVISCRVLAVDAPRLLRFTWKGGPVDTVVTWTLSETADGTRFRVEQSGFRGVRSFFVSLLLRSGGRTLYGERLPELLDRRAGRERAECMRASTRFFRFVATLFGRRPRPGA